MTIEAHASVICGDIYLAFATLLTVHDNNIRITDNKVNIAVYFLALYSK